MRLKKVVGWLEIIIAVVISFINLQLVENSFVTMSGWSESLKTIIEIIKTFDFWTAILISIALILQGIVNIRDKN